MIDAALERLLVGRDPEPMIPFGAALVHRHVVPALTRLKLELTDEVLRHLEEIYDRYVDNVASAPRSPPGGSI